ncbi:hypothetical protein BC940DRAFT_337891 [Gongronella butleri]|nr:hypothetical protein BC940DRAFT_337891 [Gongronella butleri]
MLPLLIEDLTRYISIGGAEIEAIATKDSLVAIDPVCYKNRQERDKSKNHHLTLVNPIEVSAKLTKAGFPKETHDDKVKEWIANWVSTYGPIETWEKPIDLGLGVLYTEPEYRFVERQPKKKLTKKERKQLKQQQKEKEQQAQMKEKDKTDETDDPRSQPLAMAAETTTSTSKSAAAAMQDNPDASGDEKQEKVELIKELKRPGAVSYYRVVHWPFGQRLRKDLGLPPAHFHITIGFNPRDIHKYKGPATLHVLQSEIPLEDTEPLLHLSQYASFYTKDIDYFTKLLRACEINELTHITTHWRDGLSHNIKNNHTSSNGSKDVD